MSRDAARTGRFIDVAGAWYGFRSIGSDKREEA
jgi:hypothetical protein